VGLHQEGITERHLETAEPTREAKLEVTAVPIRGKITQQNVNLRILTLPPGPKRPLQAQEQQAEARAQKKRERKERARRVFNSVKAVAENIVKGKF
jgi:hypothetical protein